MPSPLANSLSQHFAGVTDPRSEHNIRHSLLNIITIAICGVVGDADSWVDIEMFGNAKKRWFETFHIIEHRCRLNAEKFMLFVFSSLLRTLVV
jgi:hypothetical protein